MNVYLDNASTSFPKPKAVCDSIYNFLANMTFLIIQYIISYYLIH